MKFASFSKQWVFVFLASFVFFNVINIDFSGYKKAAIKHIIAKSFEKADNSQQIEVANAEGLKSPPPHAIDSEPKLSAAIDLLKPIKFSELIAVKFFEEHIQHFGDDLPARKAFQFVERDSLVAIRWSNPQDGKFV